MTIMTRIARDSWLGAFVLALLGFVVAIILVIIKSPKIIHDKIHGCK